MTIRYFEGTGTLYIEFRDCAIVEAKDLDAHTTIEMEAEGNLLATAAEHASTRPDPRHLTV